MKTIIYNIILSTFLFGTIELNAQCQICIDTVSFRCYNGVASQVHFIDNYKITNNTNEEYLTLVALTPINNKTKNELIRIGLGHELIHADQLSKIKGLTKDNVTKAKNKHDATYKMKKK